MTTHKSIVLAIELAESQRDQAWARLQKTRQADVQAQAQMRQLTDYLQEKEQRWLHDGAQTTVSAELLHHHYQFVGRLTQAIELQQRALLDSQQRVELAEQALLACEVRLASFRQLLVSRRQVQAQQRLRREQKQMDEFAQQQVQRQQRWHQEQPV